MELSSMLTGVAILLGAGLILAGIFAFMLLLAGVALALVFIKTRQILIPGASLFIINLLETPIRYTLWLVSIEEDVVSRMSIDIRNLLYREKYEKTAYSERAIFLPQCLRHPQCPAPLTPEGIKCLNCGRCGIGKIKEKAEELGCRFFISPGSSLIKRMVKKYRPKAVLGVGCHMEVKEGTSKMASYGLPVQGVLLERDGCVDTRVDVADLMERIKSGKGFVELDKNSFDESVRISSMWNTEKDHLEVIGLKRKAQEKDKW